MNVRERDESPTFFVAHMPRGLGMLATCTWRPGCRSAELLWTPFPREMGRLRSGRWNVAPC